jgi:hypothetical protein
MTASEKIIQSKDCLDKAMKLPANTPETDKGKVLNLKALIHAFVFVIDKNSKAQR